MVPLNALAAPKAELWPYWQESNESSLETISHKKWKSILDAYLSIESSDGVNRFNYDAVSDSDRALLESYLAELQKIDPRNYNRNEQFAYWVNLYNALTVEIILKHYPVSSIKQIRYWSSLFGPWSKKVAKVAGEKISLNDIEHRILRPIWQDPRIHFVVNCASIGCPNLLPEPLNSQSLETQLDLAAKDFLTNPRAVRVEGQELILSSIFEWYAEDFGSDEEEVVLYIKTLLNSHATLKTGSPNKIRYEYNWSLNDQN